MIQEQRLAARWQCWGRTNDSAEIGGRRRRRWCGRWEWWDDDYSVRCISLNHWRGKGSPRLLLKKKRNEKRIRFWGNVYKTVFLSFLFFLLLSLMSAAFCSIGQRKWKKSIHLLPCTQDISPAHTVAGPFDVWCFDENVCHDSKHTPGTRHIRGRPYTDRAHSFHNFSRSTAAQYEDFAPFFHHHLRSAFCVLCARREQVCAVLCCAERYVNDAAK